MLNLFITTAAAAGAKDAPKKCHALAMSGGGSFGSYEAGVLYGLVKNAEDPSDFAWDVMSGVSAGSINSVAGSMWPPGTENEMVEWLSEVWQNVTTSDVYNDWEPYGVVTGITQKSGAFNDTPGFVWGEEIVEEQGGKANRMFVASCVDANQGHYVPFNETVNITKASISSSSIPAAFEYRKWDDYFGPGEDVICIDGGSVWNINIASAIDRCRGAGFEDKDIILDVVWCDKMNGTLSWKDRDNAISNLEYYKKIKAKTTNSNNIA